LLLHALVLSLPLSHLDPPVPHDANYVEIEFSAFLHNSLETPEPGPDAVPSTDIQPRPEVLPKLAEEITTHPTNITPSVQGPISPSVVEEQPATITQPMIRAQTDIILSQQFITEGTVIDRIFNKPLNWQHAKTRSEFRFPARPGLLTMLDRPMQDLPFEYTPGLVHFAYAPGVRGDLQRFWDVITPEFGWRTNSGTEVRCILLLVIVGCGWK